MPEEGVGARARAAAARRAAAAASSTGRAVQAVGQADEALEIAARGDLAQGGAVIRSGRAAADALEDLQRVVDLLAVWVATRLARRRQEPAGTAGGATGLVKTPSSKSLRQKRKVSSSSPR